MSKGPHCSWESRSGESLPGATAGESRECFDWQKAPCRVGHRAADEFGNVIVEKLLAV